MFKSLREKIKEELFKLSDINYKEFHSKLCPGTNNIIGVRVPVLRKYAKELAKKIEIEDLLIQIDNVYYEEIMLQGMLIGLGVRDFSLLKNYIKEFIPKIDNWAICDIFCSELKITRNYREEMWEFLQKYLLSKKEFEVRFAIVMILSYYIDEEYIKRDFEVFKSVKNQDYYVQMAIAWAISICLIKFYDETIEFLKSAKLDKFTYNKSIQKAIESFRITDIQKRELRSMKI